MKLSDSIFSSSERVMFSLRSLYEESGYSRYKMSKFEEYGLYAKNKDFLISDSIITFTDIGGRLMALKPDVTLSIVKNGKDVKDGVQKVYYNENVYRVNKGSDAFKEIMQVGIECIGDIDSFCISEVLLLAAKSLKSISEDFVLDISHLGILSSLLKKAGLEASAQKIVKCISEKNLHELLSLCEQEKVSEENVSLLSKLVTVSGSPKNVLPLLCDMFDGSDEVKQLEEIYAVFCENGLENNLRIDFSVVSDISYYNGIVFKGYVENVFEAVLSGGQYDKLLRKMGRSASAIGFAVYLDSLNFSLNSASSLDAEALLLYDSKVDFLKLTKAADELRNNYCRVLVSRTKPENGRYGKIFKFGENGVTEVEDA